MEISDIIKQTFEHLSWADEPHNLYQPIDYALSSGGKRLRPMLVLLAGRLFGGDPEQMAMPAAAMEVFHNFTLLHDDVMDRADIRRGRPTVARKWNENTAILSGDAMLVKAYQLLDSVPDARYRDAIRLFSQTALEVCEGQQLDADFEQQNDVSLDDYFRMIRLKTGVLLAGSLRMGALLAGASLSDQQLIYDFGINIGIAFQIWDDYLDCYGDEAVFGKKIGGDILSGKRTFLLVSTLINGLSSQKQTIRQLLNNTNVLPEEKIAAVIDIYNRLKMPELCRNEMNKYYALAMSKLDAICRPDDLKEPLRALASRLIDRNN